MEGKEIKEYHKSRIYHTTANFIKDKYARGYDDKVQMNKFDVPYKIAADFKKLDP